ncbi:MAG: sugar phosphate nucleotidyltransferase, partial [Candidatus Woesearchaeota archaeon]
MIKPQVVILAGGRGMRLGREVSVPKPLVKIGDKPILWHVMKLYQHFGFNDFIICLGYEASKIENEMKKFKDFKMTFVDTGLDTMTGGRIKKIQRCIRGDVFFCTYADGLASINIRDLLDFHLKKKQIATITVVHPTSQFGIVELNSEDVIISFKEKPPLNEWINGGFFVFNKKIFEYLGDNDILEKTPFDHLVKDRQINGYKFGG